MEHRPAHSAPYFDTRALREELTGYYWQLSGREGRLRQKVLGRLKELVADARTTAQRELEASGNGRACAMGHSLFMDELIRLIYDFTVHHVYRAQNPSAAERMAIIATGGYGRGLMAPGSDIDLLFLLPYKQTAWGESVVEFILYLLWDLSFKVGHATRTVKQCVRLSRADMTIRTAVLDKRLILGDTGLFDELEQRFRSDVICETGPEFIKAKFEERDERHERAGQSRYLVEPNIKDGKGGLRDLHTLHWVAKYLLDVEPGKGGAVTEGLLSPKEHRTYRTCEDFLWTVRCHLHFETGRAEERLSFDFQPTLAKRLGYTPHGGLRTVERFMKHYFMIAKEVGDLTRAVCAMLEIKQLRKAPTLNRMLTPLTWRKRVQIRNTSDFRIDNGRINVADKRVFERDPVNIIRLFARAETYNVLFHPEAIRLVRRSLHLIDDALRANPEANRIFLDLLTAKLNPEEVLRRINETGVLGRFIPAFGRIVSMMQFNMYHHFTVDEHLIRAVGILAGIESGRLEDDHPLSTQIIHNIQSRRALYVATFLHDIAKGRDEDHSIAGARAARALCPRLGLSDAETETVAWLVEYHLLMSNVSQSRDLNDRKTVLDFADIVQSPERLKLLVMLTVADIRAVGPGVWNGWKGQLLRRLYFETEPILAGGHSQISFQERITAAKEKLRHARALADWPAEEVERSISRHYPAYWLRTDTEKQVEHAKLFRRAEKEGAALVIDFTTDTFTAVTELTVLTANHPFLLAKIAGACAAVSANIVSAQISTTRDGMALNSFLLQRAFERDADERRRGGRIRQSVEKLLKGEIYLDQLLRKRAEPRGRIRAFSVAPQLVLDNALSNVFTVIEVNGLDRPGLLYELTSALAELNLAIKSAHITTFGEKAVDVFYVTDLTGRKVTYLPRQKVIRNRLMQVLGGVEAPGGRTAKAASASAAQ